MTLASSNYDSDRYDFEKLIGKRRLTGALNLKRLKPVHKVIMVLHARGWKNKDIVIFLEGAGRPCSEQMISHTINDPMFQSLLQPFHEGVDNEIKTLEVLSVDVIKNALENGSIREQLTAVDRVFKASGRYNDKNTGAETAEDVMARCLAVMQNQSEAVNNLVRKSPNILDITPIARQLDVEGD